MRFLLINPHYPISETPSPPLGIAYLAAALERIGVEIRILDCVVFPYDRSVFSELLSEFAPQVIGVTAVTMTFNHAIRIINDAKALAPELITIMGGPHATFQAREILSSYPALDLIVRGEGEDTLTDFVQTLETGHSWKEVKGIVFREGNKIVFTGDRKPVAIDSLPPPARHLLPLGRYRALGMPITMTTSRGCPFSCIFCVGRKMAGARVRYRPARQVVDEMADLGRLGFHQINIADDLFTASPKHCLDICVEIRRRGIEPSWTAFSRVDTITPEILTAMREAGCHTISFGVESGNPEMLARIKKGITLDGVLKAADMCRKAGIAAFASFILGLPGETPRSLSDTLDFGKMLKEYGVLYGFHFLAPFPGTDIHENRHRYDIRILSEDWDDYHANRAVTETSSIRREELDRIALEWERDFLIRLGEIDAERSAGTATPEDARMLTRLEHTVKIYEWMMAKAVEEKGHWDLSDSNLPPETLMEILAERLSGSAKKDRQSNLETIRYACDGDNLTYQISDSIIRWAWKT